MIELESNSETRPTDTALLFIPGKVSEENMDRIPQTGATNQIARCNLP